MLHQMLRTQRHRGGRGLLRPAFKGKVNQGNKAERQGDLLLSQRKK